MTKAQSRAFTNWTVQYHLDPQTLCAQARPVGMEIGFGMGQALVAWAREAPDWQLCGIELYQPGIGALTDALRREDITNVGIMERPAQQVMAEMADAAVAEIRIFFPDPWPKKRHHKRRLIQPAFVAELARVVAAGGIVRLATDWTPYADWMRECFDAVPQFVSERDYRREARDNLATEGRAITKFERRGEKLGHEIHDLVYRRAG